MGQEIIRYLTEEERGYTRSLYEQCFPEDSRKFVEYYYEHKTKNNRILVMEAPGAGRTDSLWPQVMLHLNPYVFRIGKQLCSLNYIVAVATDPAVRKQGKMYRVMEQALKDMAAQGQPFTFLIPANPLVYESSGFVFVPEGEPDGGADREAVEEIQGLQVGTPKAEEIPKLAECANEWLAAQYDAFPLRNEAYMKGLLRETAALDGGILRVADPRNGMVGIADYGREAGEAELLHLLAAEADRNQVREAVRQYLLAGGALQVSEAELSFMVRILDLPRLMELVGGVCRQDFRLRVRLSDRILPENNGCFELYCQGGTGGLRPISEEDADREMDAAQLAEELFGRIRLYIREWV